MEFKHINVPGMEEENQPAPAPAQPKKGRGRPRKDQSQPQAQAKPEQKQQTPKLENDIFSQIKNEIDSNQAQQDFFNTPQANETPAAPPTPTFLLDGYLILAFADVLCPEVVKFIFRKKLASVETSKLMLTEQQKKSLEPLADEIAKQVSGYINPLHAFFIALGSMYYQNAKKYV